MDRKKLNIEFDGYISESSSNYACNKQCATLCTTEIKQLLENSVVSRKTIEAFAELVEMKNKEIKTAEEKLYALQIEHKERENIYDQKIKDKDDLIMVLTQNSSLIQNKLDQLMDQLSLKDNKISKLENEIAKNKLESTNNNDLKEIMDSTPQHPRQNDYQSTIKKLEQNIVDLNLKVQNLEVDLANKQEKIDKWENKLEIVIPYGYTKTLLSVPNTVPFRVIMKDVSNEVGAIVIQNRCVGNLSFDKNLKSYHNGFGKVDGDFWLGLEKIHRITMQERHCLLINIVDYQKTEYIVMYDNFAIAGKDENYKLNSLGKYYGFAGDMMRINEGMEFRVRSSMKRGWWDLNGIVPHCNLNGIHSKSQNCRWDTIYWGLNKCGSEPKNVFSVNMSIFTASRIFLSEETYNSSIK